MSSDRPLPSPMCTAALQYARRGWPVFPCREKPETIVVQTANGPADRVMNAKAPYGGKGGLNKATTDERTINDWWRKWPDAMIGLPLGGATKLFALDFDPRVDPDTGEVFTLDALKAALEEQIGCALPISLASRTQSGGVHVFYRQPEGDPIRNRGNLPQHVDVRGEGGYVIVAPSRMAEECGGGRYRWLEGRQDTVPVEAPAALIEILRAPKARAKRPDAGGDQPPSAPSSPRPSAAEDPAAAAVRKYALSALDEECRTLADTPLGSRNNQCNASGFAIGQLIGAQAISESMGRMALHAAVTGFNDPDKARVSIDNGITAGMADPRDLRDVAEKARARASRPSRLASRSPSGPRPPGGDGGGQSFRVEGAGGHDINGGSGGEDADALHRRCIFKPHTDLGNAERFFERHGQDFRWSPALGWMGWDGRRWITLDQDEKNVPPVVMDAVFRTIRDIQDEGDLIEATGGVRPEWLDLWEQLPEERRYERDLSESRQAELALYRKHQEQDAAGEGDDRDRLNCVVDYKKGRAVTRADAHRKWGRTSEASGKLGCIARLAQPWMAVKADAFDADPLAINVMNGTLRFRRRLDGAPGKTRWLAEWKLEPHQREDLISKLAPVEYDRDATCPIYDDMFSWAQPEEKMRRYLHQWAGLNLTGHMGEQILHFWYGRGGNAKSTTIDAWAAATGDYSTTVPIETFLDQGIKKRGDQATPDLARLGGVRMLRTSEPERGAKLAAALIKLVTGGEPMAVRFLNRGFFDLRPIFKLTISGNYRPEIPDTDDGIWRRVKLIPWKQRVRDQQHPEGTREKDPDLPQKLLGELPGIFNRLMAGLLDWLANGLVEPEDVTKATEQYRTQSDPLARFLTLCTRASPEARVQSSKLHELFVAWCRAAGEKEWSNKGFSQAMTDKGFSKKASDGMQWLGIETTRQVSDFIDHEGKALPFNVEDDGGSQRATSGPMHDDGGGLADFGPP